MGDLGGDLTPATRQDPGEESARPVDLGGAGCDQEPGHLRQRAKADGRRVVFKQHAAQRRPKLGPLPNDGQTTAGAKAAQGGLADLLEGLGVSWREAGPGIGVKLGGPVVLRPHLSGQLSADGRGS